MYASNSHTAHLSLDEKTFEYAAVSYFWENEYAEGEKRQEFTHTMRIFVQTKKDKCISIQKVMDIVGLKGLSEWHVDKDSIDKPINAVEANFATIGNCQKHHKAGMLRLKGAKGNAKKNELGVDTASAGEGGTISSFDTDTPPSVTTERKRKKCSQFSLNKSPSKKNADKPSKHRNPNKKEDVDIGEIKFSKMQRSSQAAYESTNAHLSDSGDDNYKGKDYSSNHYKTGTYGSSNMDTDIKISSVPNSNNNTSRAMAATGNVTNLVSSTRTDLNNNNTSVNATDSAINVEMLAQALRGQLSRLSSANNEGGIANLLSLISNTIVTSGVAHLEPVVHDMWVVYTGTNESEHDKTEQKEVHDDV